VTGEYVVQWCLSGRRVGQKSPIEIQHAQKSTEHTGTLRRVAVLEICHSFFQSLRTLGGHLVTEEGEHVCSEDAFRLVEDDPIPLKLVEENP
jgi:hypothetical protein